MVTLKEAVVEICIEVAAEFPGWEFKAGQFKKKVLSHCDVVISGGFSYDSMSTCLLPSVQIDHSKVKRLCKNMFGFAYGTSHLRFDAVEGFLDTSKLPWSCSSVLDRFRLLRDSDGGHFKREWNNGTIVKSKEQFFGAAPQARKLAEKYIDILEVRTVIRAMVRDGITLLNRYYDQASEDSLLRGLPPKYVPHFKHDNPPGLNGTAGIAACIAHIYIGDFEFFDWYRSDACETVLPKKVADLEKIALALPELKKMFGRAAG